MTCSSSAQCHICKSGPFLLCNLYAHLRFVHYCTEDEVNAVRRAIKRAKYNVLQEAKCQLCGKAYFSDGGLRKHMRTVHEKRASTQSKSPAADKVRTSYVSCPECEEPFSSNLELAAHCESNHCDEDADFTVVEINFSCWKTFELWKARKERETITKLVRRTARRSSKGTTYIYACQHSGRCTKKFDPNGKKRNKKCKRNSKHCPCFARVTQRLDETVDVVACFGHLGHEVNSALLPISEDDQLVVRSMILLGLPFKEIVNQLRITHWNVEAPPEMQPRLCHLTVRDVGNIAARHGLLASNKDYEEECSTPMSFFLEEEEEEEEEGIARESLVDYKEQSDEELELIVD